MIQKIIIADDHSLILDGFENIIHSHFPDITIYRVKDKLSLFELLRTHKIDLLFQDIKFGKHDARDFIKELKQEFQDLKIIMISTLNDQNTIQMLLKQNINGYISKADDSAEIIKAINQISSGQKYLSSGIKNTHFHFTPSNEIFLTVREKEILSLIINGFTTKEIANQLFLSDKTVEVHRSNLFMKFDVKHVAALVKKAIYAGYS